MRQILLKSYIYNIVLPNYFRERIMREKSPVFYKVLMLFLLVFINKAVVFGQELTIHAHRGGAALYPENTIESMLHAVSIGVRAIEFDLHISSDHKVVVSHDFYINSAKALDPEGKGIGSLKQFYLRLYSMPYKEIMTYDVGSLAQEEYPERKNFKAHIPLLSDLIDQVEAQTVRNGMEPVTYTIEIKSHRFKDGLLTPHYTDFVELVMAVLLPYQLEERLIIQSFDVRTLNYIHKTYPTIQLSYLFKGKKRSVENQLKRLGFTPSYYSPHFKLVDKALVEDAHRKGMFVVPWTVDDRNEAIRLQGLGVDGLITNYPHRMQEWVN